MQIPAVLKTSPAVTVLRLLASASCFSAAIIMVTSHESVSILGLTFDAKYQYTPAFRFLVAVNSVVAIYSLIILFVPPGNFVYTIIPVADLLAALFLTSSISAAGSIAFVAKKGSPHAGWYPVCNRIPRFCHQNMGALIANTVSTSVYTTIVLLAMRSKNSLEAPKA